MKTRKLRSRKSEPQSQRHSVRAGHVICWTPKYGLQGGALKPMAMLQVFVIEQLVGREYIPRKA